MSRYTRLLNADHDTTAEQPPAAATPPNSMSNMLASLKESAANAGGSMREGMAKANSSVRTGLGLPTGAADDDSVAQSEASSIVDDVSEYCPKLTFHQVRFILRSPRLRGGAQTTGGRDVQFGGPVPARMIRVGFGEYLEATCHCNMMDDTSILTQQCQNNIEWIYRG